MATKVKQLPFPDFLLSEEDCHIELNSEGITEQGEPKKVLKKDVKYIFSEKTKRIITPEGKRVDLIGKVIVKGDIAPDIPKISGGSIKIGDKVVDIHSAARPRNPNGTIHHTTFEVM